MTTPPLEWLRPSLAARTRFFDDQVIGAVAAGVDQIVVVGAGYDDRALRFRTRAVRFYEIDHLSTQRDKIRRLRTMGAETENLVLVSADFRCDDVPGALAKGGHDARSPSLFICEGVLVYLDQQTLTTLLASLRACAALKSTLAASLATHSPDVESENVIAVANARRRAAETEPWLTILPAAAHLELFAETGWEVKSAVDAAELEEGAEWGRTLLVAANPRRARDQAIGGTAP
jgi:methyltransferase (TIGR00027 family)